MEPDPSFLRAWARKELTRGLQVSRALLDEFDSVAAVVDPVLPLQVYNGKPGLSRAAYEQSIVEWREGAGKRMPCFDLDRGTRERLLHFLSGPERVLLLEDAHTSPTKRNRRQDVKRPLRAFYRRPTADEEETYVMVRGPIADERVPQYAIRSSPTAQEWRHVGALLDGVGEDDIPGEGSIVEDVTELAGKAVGMIFGLSDNEGHVFFWSEDAEGMAVPDRVRTAPHATEFGWWWEG